MREAGYIFLLLTTAVILLNNSAYACQKYNAPNCEQETDGYYPHEHLCNHFYICVNGQRSLLKCSDEQVFDSENLMCRSGITCEERCTEPFDYIQCPETAVCEVGDLGRLLPYPPDCTKYIYCEDDGSGSLSVCAPGLHFNAEIQGCVDPSEANCPFCVILTTTTVPTTTIAVCPEPESCSNHSEGELLAYPSDCSKYFYCDELGNAEESVCPIGQLFNESLQGCVDPAEANCQYCVVLDTTTEGFDSTTIADSTTPVSITTTDSVTITTISTTETQSTTNEITSTATSSTTETPTSQTETTTITAVSSTEVSTTSTEDFTTIPLCGEIPTCEVGEYGDLKPYPLDCGRYIYCNRFGGEEISKCPLNQEFSPILLECLPPEDANCPLCQTTTEEITTTTVLTISTIAECPATPTCAIGEEGQLKSYPPECTMYIYCYDNASYSLRKCPAGNEFNPTKSKCMTPELANCPYCELTTIPTTIESTTEITFTSEIDTTADTTLSTSTVSSTITTEITSSTQLPECPPLYICTILDLGEFKPYPSDCQKYIVCTGRNTYRLTKCLFGRHFSPTLEGCVDPEIAGCTNCSITTSTTTELMTTAETETTTDVETTTEAETTTDQTTITSTFSTTVTTDTTFMTPLPECPPLYQCTILDIGEFKPYPPDCQNYIVCTGRNTYRLVRCLFGRHFSPTLEGCVDPEIAGCPNCTESTTTVATTIEFTTTTVEIETTAEYTSTSSETETILPCEELRSCMDYPVGKLLPVPANCSQYIYCGVGGGELSSCAPGFNFDEMSQACLPSNTTVCLTCEPLSTESTTDIWSTTTEIVTTIPPCPEVPTCDDVPEGTNLPYPSNCSMYIYCDALGEEISFCRPGYHFSMEIGFCVPADQANCPLCFEITTTTIGTTTIPICPATPECYLGEYDIRKPYPPDCTQYVYCSGTIEGPGRVRRCIPGTLFDHATARCLNESIAVCPYCEVLTTTAISTGMTTPLQTTTVTIETTQDNTTPTLSTQVDTTLTSSTQEDTTTTEVTTSTTEETTLTSEVTTSTTEEITSTTEQTTSTTEETTSTTEATQESSTTTPTIYSTTTETATESTSTTEYTCPTQKSCNGSASLGEQYPIVGDCTNYIYCDGVGHTIRTCLPNQYFDYNLEWCVDEADAFCPAYCATSTTEYICPTQKTCNGSDTLGDQYPIVGDCTNYIYCNGVSQEIRTCPSTQYFDYNLEWCVAEADAFCPDFCASSTSTTDDVTSSTTDDAISSTTDDVTSSTTDLTTSPPAIPTCPPTPTCGMFDSGLRKAYPPDCNKYILCDTMQAVLQDCQPGEHFSPAYTRCMLIANAGCQLCTPSKKTNNYWTYITGLFL